jgi:hypothetical protein
MSDSIFENIGKGPAKVSNIPDADLAIAAINGNMDLLLEGVLRKMEKDWESRKKNTD